MRRLLLVLALLSSAVLAASYPVTWKNPTQNTDGSALALQDIKQTRIEFGTCNGTGWGTTLKEIVVPGTGTSATSPDLTPGTWCGRAFTQNIYGVESGPSNVYQKVVAAPTPNSPTNFSF